MTAIIDLSALVKSSASAVNLTGAQLTAGEESMARTDLVSAVALTSGTMRLSYFTARKSETINNLKVMTATTAAAATPTLVRMGLYQVSSSTGRLALVASTANDTTLLAAASTAYSKALSSAYAKVAGRRYAFGVLVVTAAATPTLAGMAWMGAAAEFLLDPTKVAQLTGQTDLPASILPTALTASSSDFYGVCLP